MTGIEQLHLSINRAKKRFAINCLLITALFGISLAVSAPYSPILVVVGAILACYSLRVFGLGVILNTKKVLGHQKMLGEKESHRLHKEFGAVKTLMMLSVIVFGVMNPLTDTQYYLESGALLFSLLFCVAASSEIVFRMSKFGRVSS